MAVRIATQSMILCTAHKVDTSIRLDTGCSTEVQLEYSTAVQCSAMKISLIQSQLRLRPPDGVTAGCHTTVAVAVMHAWVQQTPSAGRFTALVQATHF